MKIDKIRTDGGTQVRAVIDDDVVATYAESMRAGEKFPRPVVYFDGTDHWLADGFHRVAAHRTLGASEVDVEVRTGTRREAILSACGANASHGLRRTNADKRRAVELLLADEEWSKKSDRWVADVCAVSAPLVASVRPTVNSYSSKSESAREGKDGKSRKSTRRTTRVVVPVPDNANDTDDVAEEDLDVIEAEDAPVPASRDDSGFSDSSFAVTRAVTDGIGKLRDAERLVREAYAVDVRIAPEVTRRLEDAALRLAESVLAKLPLDGKRAIENRSRFQVLSGGK